MTIAEVSRKYGLSADTLRYYERSGLIPPVQRTASGIRNYTEEDCKWVYFSKCLRSAGMPVENAMGNMVVDIGGGTTEVAVISLGGIVTSKSLRIAGDAMDEAIVAYVKRSFNLMIGERTAEQMKMTIGTAYVDETTPEERMTIKGRDVITGLPRTIEVNNFQVADALYDPVMAMVEAVKATLEKTPPELAADIMDAGSM